ncbi:hypothetical protein BC937DRAFT_92475 [Endogone sp. FLAS-F59071]|nr:hypothetical protein BC937DRAFT_92475 [Endogone sp. FLAS-F59071]|eukprot:RUS21506.1 hypothetical protein BC937DRAFT_92475 [Endogone sp. FLAS-F59071]
MEQRSLLARRITHIFYGWVFTGVVLNVYETVDVMSIARSGKYHELDMPVGEALEARPEV